MAYLTVSIETLRAGDWVLTRDEHNPEGPLVLRRIEEVFENVAYQLQLVTLRSSNGQEHTITTTAEHRAYQLGEGLGGGRGVWARRSDRRALRCVNRSGLPFGEAR